MPYTHRHFATIDSTNSRLLADLRSGELDLSVHHLYTADEQTAGRGQHGRSWISPKGNVLLSFYTPMTAVADAQTTALAKLSGVFSLLVGYFLAKMPAIVQLNQQRQRQNLPMIGVKWANDLGFYDEQYRLFQKLAGILIEPVYADYQGKNRLIGVITGVGLNVATAPQIADGLYQATCVRDLWQGNDWQNPVDWYEPMCQAICQATTLHNAFDQQSVRTKFIDDFNACHLLMGREVGIFAQDQMQAPSAVGHCVGIDEQGALLLRDADGRIERIFAGMVQKVCH